MLPRALTLMPCSLAQLRMSLAVGTCAPLFHGKQRLVAFLLQCPPPLARGQVPGRQAVRVVVPASLARVPLAPAGVVEAHETGTRVIGQLWMIPCARARSISCPASSIRCRIACAAAVRQRFAWK